MEVGTIVRVRFEEFQLQNDHPLGRVFPPRTIYRSIKISKIDGEHLFGYDIRTKLFHTFNTRQIISLL